MTESADPNLNQAIYEVEDAICFAASWTGLGGAIVRQIVEAKGRYLELARIAEVQDDEALSLERQTWRHLLPETPNFIDGRQSQYVAQVTGVSLGIVQRAEQGELAYLDSLGLLHWDNEEARNDRLGSPYQESEILFDETEFDEDDPVVMEGHEKHWACLLPHPAVFLPGHLSGLPGVQNIRYSAASPDPRWEGVAAMAIPQEGGLETLRLDGNRDMDLEFISAFPVARHGAVQRLTLHLARPWETGCEAIVLASTPSGATVSYFDTAYLHPWNEWDADEDMDIRLAGFAYRLGLAPARLNTLDDQELRVWFDPLEGGNPDEFEFEGVIVGVAKHQAWDQLVYRLEVTMLRASSTQPEQDFTIPVYVTGPRLEGGYVPREGDAITGAIWLQGARA